MKSPEVFMSNETGLQSKNDSEDDIFVKKFWHPSVEKFWLIAVSGRGNGVGSTGGD